jgi:hypothetical protein
LLWPHRLTSKETHHDHHRPVEGAVLRPSEIKLHERGGGARTIPLVTRKIGSTSMLNGITEFGPNAAIPLLAPLVTRGGCPHGP